MIHQLYMVLDIFSFIIMLLLFLSNWNFHNSRLSVRYFMCMTVSLMGIYLTDGVTFCFLGHSGHIHNILLPTLWILNYLFALSLMYFFHFYEVAFINDYTTKKESYQKTYYLVATSLIVLIWILGIVFGFFVTFDGLCHFHNTKWQPLSQLLFFFLIGPDIYRIFKYYPVLGAKVWTWIIFIFSPLFARFLDLLLGISLSYPITGLGLVFIDDALNQETDMALKVQQVQLQKQEQELQDTREKIVISQIQPHFLYNVLNTICYLCRKDP